jgi:dihydroorotase
LANNKDGLITTEVCPQHLTFDEKDVAKRGTRLIMNPPIRYSEDREILWQRLKDGTIDCIATDHAPHTIENKLLGFPKAHSGMPGVETSLPMMLTHALEGKCSIPEVVRWMCEGPAKVYNIQNKGYIKEKKDADLVLVDMETKRRIQDKDVWSRVGWTAYSDMDMVGWPMYTIVGGKIVHLRKQAGSLRGESIASPGSAGKALKFGIN